MPECQKCNDAGVVTVPYIAGVVDSHYYCDCPKGKAREKEGK